MCGGVSTAPDADHKRHQASGILDMPHPEGVPFGCVAQQASECDVDAWACGLESPADLRFALGEGKARNALPSVLVTGPAML